MKKLITLLSIVVILSFALTVCIKLIPQKSRDGLIKTEVPTPESTVTSTPVIPPIDGDTTVYPDFKLTGELLNEPVNVKEIKIGDISFYIPRLSNSDHPDVAEKINSVLKDRSMDHINNYREECNFLAMDFDPEEMSAYKYNTSSHLYISENTVSVKMVSEIDYGSVLTEKRVFCYNFSAKTGEFITLDYLEIDKNALAEAIIEKSLTMTDVEFASNYQDYIRENICNSWYIDKKTIHLVYVPLEIASEIQGTVEITVDIDSIK